MQEIFGSYGKVSSVDLAVDKRVNLPKVDIYLQRYLRAWKWFGACYKQYDGEHSGGCNPCHSHSSCFLLFFFGRARAPTRCLK